MRKWKVKDKILKFPSNWSKDMVMALVNHKFIHICEICGKFDILSDHYTLNH